MSATPRDLGISKEERARLDAEIEKSQAEEKQTLEAQVKPKDAREFVAHPIAALFPLLEGDDYAQMVESIRTNGLRDPIILCEGKILDGRNRYRACQDAGVEPRFRSLSPEINPWDYVWDKNAVRRHLEAGTRAAIFVDFEEGADRWVQEHQQVHEEADAARAEAVKTQPRSDDGRHFGKRPPGTASTRKKKTGHEASARRAKVSPTTLKRAVELRKQSPALFAQVKDGKLPLKKALHEVKLEKKRALAAQLDAKPVPLPTGKFDVIASDPSWPYDTREDDYTHRGKMMYPPMPLEKIMALPVEKLAAKDCVLFLWTTNAFLADGSAAAVVKAYNFQAKTILTWKKPRMGAGNYLRNITEHCIVAVRGNPVLTLTNETTWIEGEVREHSRKPESFYALVEKLCHGTKLEMFSRVDRRGWMHWGAETGSLNPDAASSAAFMV